MKKILSFSQYKKIFESSEEEISVEYYPKNNRNRKVVKALSKVIYESEDEAKYTELYFPDDVKKSYKSLDERRKFFCNMISMVDHLWVVRYSEQIVGFFVIREESYYKPYRTTIGFGINSKYAGKGILLEAFNKIKDKLNYPIYGETSRDNIGCQKLMTKMGFVKVDDYFEEGEGSFRYVLEKI